MGEGDRTVTLVILASFEVIPLMSTHKLVDIVPRTNFESKLGCSFHFTYEEAVD